MSPILRPLWRALGVLSISIMVGCGGGGGGGGVSSGSPNTEPDPRVIDTLVNCNRAGLIFNGRTCESCSSGEIREGNQCVPADGVAARNNEFARSVLLDRIGVRTAYSRGYYGQGVTVGVVDTAVRTTHDDLDGNIVPGYNVTERNNNLGDDSASGHGTAVAGIIAAERNGDVMHGVAPQAKLMPVQIGNRRGVLEGALSVHLGYREGLRRGVKIFNNSFGYDHSLYGTYNGVEYNVKIPLFEMFWNLPVTDNNYRGLAGDILNATRDENGVLEDAVWVWAAGNLGWHSNGAVRFCDKDDTMCETRLQGDVRAINPDTFKMNFRPMDKVIQNGGNTMTIRSGITMGQLQALPNSGTDFYAELPAVAGYGDLESQWLAVVAVRETGTGFALRESGSNGCGRARDWCLAAPGSSIYTTDSDSDTDYEVRNGTSFAAAYVSGALAVLKSSTPNMPMSVARMLLLTTAMDLGLPGVDDDFGQGLINLDAAIDVQQQMALVGSGNYILPTPSEADDSYSDTSDFGNDEFGNDNRLDNINANAAYRRGYFGQGAVVAVLDTGMLTTHEDLNANIVKGFNPRKAGSNDEHRITDPINDYWNQHGHGTHVGGVIAAERNDQGVHGVAPEASLMPIQLGDSVGEGEGGRLGYIVEGIQYAVTNNAHIVNASFGRVNRLVGMYEGTRYQASLPYLRQFWPGADGDGDSGDEDSREIKDIVLAKGGADIVFVWAAGNDSWNDANPDDDDQIRLCEDISGGLAGRCGKDRFVSQTSFIDNFVSEEYNSLYTMTVSESEFPGDTNHRRIIQIPSAGKAYGSLATLGLATSGTGLYGMLPFIYPELENKWLVAVATDSSNNLAEFSNGCGEAMSWCLAAPGMNIYSTTGHNTRSFARLNGTSFAAPHVSGALALLKSRMPDMPMSVIRAVLLTSATDLGEEGVDDIYGWGLVNIETAITMQGNINIPSPSAGTAVNLMQARIELPALFADARGRFESVSVAVSVIGDSYYNTNLGGLADINELPENDLANVGKAMLESPSSFRREADGVFAATDPSDGVFRYAGAQWDWQSFGQWRIHHDLCEQCSTPWWNQWDDNETSVSGAPLFASNQKRYVLENINGNWRPFVAGGVGETPYYQYGIKWHNQFNQWNLSVEGSRIIEQNRFMGADFGSLGKTSANSQQLRARVQGILGFGVQGYAGYDFATANVNVKNGGFLQSVSNVQAHGWQAGLQGQNAFSGGDVWRLSFQQLPSANGNARINFAKAACLNGGNGDCFEESFYDDVPGAPSFQQQQIVVSDSANVDLSSKGEAIVSAGYAFSPWDNGRLALGAAKELHSGRAGLSAFLKIEL